MELLTALKAFADALVSRTSQADIDKATTDLHATLNPGAATDAQVPTPTPVKLS